MGVVLVGGSAVFGHVRVCEVGGQNDKWSLLLQKYALCYEIIIYCVTGL